MRDRVLGPQEGAADMNPVHRIHRVFRIIFDAADRAGIACIGKQDIDLAPFGDGGGDIGLGLCRIADIGGACDEIFRCEFCSRSVEVFLLQVDNQDLRAMVQKQPRRCLPDASRPAGDDADLVL